jgi:hypothetical protein
VCNKNIETAHSCVCTDDRTHINTPHSTHHTTQNSQWRISAIFSNINGGYHSSLLGSIRPYVDGRVVDWDALFLMLKAAYRHSVSSSFPFLTFSLLISLSLSLCFSHFSLCSLLLSLTLALSLDFSHPCLFPAITLILFPSHLAFHFLFSIQ